MKFASIQPQNKLCDDEERDFLLADWKLWKHIVSTPSSSNAKNSTRGRTYAILTIRFSVSRNFSYYIWNVFLILFMLTSLSFTAFTIEPSDISSRLSVTLTLLLTVVAFKLGINSTIPKIAYNTLLDTYIWACFVFFSVIIAENSITSADAVNKVDFILAILLAIGWIVFNLSYFCGVASLYYSDKHRLEQKETLYKSIPNVVNVSPNKGNEQANEVTVQGEMLTEHIYFGDHAATVVDDSGLPNKIIVKSPQLPAGTYRVLCHDLPVLETDKSAPVDATFVVTKDDSNNNNSGSNNAANNNCLAMSTQ